MGSVDHEALARSSSTMGKRGREEVRGELKTAIDDLRVEAQADAGVFMTFAEHDDGVVATDVVRSGRLLNWGLLRGGEPPLGFDHDRSDDAIGMRQGQWCLQAPLKRHFNQFCWLHQDIGQFAPWRRTPAFDGLYNANGFSSQFRAILAHDGMVSGWCALFWKDLRDEGRRRVEKVADGFLPRLRQLGGDLLERPESHRLLLDESDELLGVNVEANERFSTDELIALGRRARRMAMTERNRWCHDSWCVHYVPMEGAAGKAYLVLLEPLEPLEIDMRRALTTLQGRVANLVAEGATNGTAADKLGVSRNTVKYHLKNIYELLGVSNRVELASFWKG